MYQAGHISKEEFQRLRKMTLGIADTAGEKDNSPLSYPPSDDDENDG